VSVPSCPTCDLLSEKVVAATTRYAKLRGDLSIAKLACGADRVSELDTLVDHAEVDRVCAVEKYSQHKNSHAGAGASASTNHES
jgi:hypothetical protein